MIVLLGLTLSGCASLEWPFGSSRAASARPAVRYVGVAALPLHREPGGVVVGELDRGEKVSRGRVEKGWARVRVASSGREGWVDDAKLVARRPRADGPKLAGDSAPAAETPSAPAPAPGPAPPPASERSRGTSVFDPF